MQNWNTHITVHSVLATKTTSTTHMHNPEEIQWQKENSLALYHWANQDKQPKPSFHGFFPHKHYIFWNKIIYLVL